MYARRRRVGVRRRRGFKAYRGSRRRRYSGYRRRRSIIPAAFPNSRTVKLVYDDVWYLNSGAGVYAVNTFRLNSIYDPDQTGAGGTPTGASTWGGMFTRYKVLGAKVQIKFVANCNQALLVGWHAYGADNNNYTTPNTATGVQQVLTEVPNSAFKMVGPANLATASATCYISRYYSMRQLLGNDVYRDLDAGAETGANPERMAYIDVMLTDALTATVGNVAFANVRITYYVRFSEKDMTYVD